MLNLLRAYICQKFINVPDVLLLYERYINNNTSGSLVSIMAFVVFLGGLLEYNSGKTTIAREMVNFFNENLSEKVSPFKPLSGNNLFYHYEQIKENIEKHEEFISLDISDLLAETSNEIEATVANPVHKVNTQALATRFFEEGSINTFYNKYQDSISLFQRFSFVDDDGSRTSTYIVNEPIYKNHLFWNDVEMTEPVLEKASEIKLFKNDHEYYSLNSKLYADSIQSSFAYLKKKSAIIVIEGFNNSAHPAWCVRESNIILLVGPGSIFLYEPETYFRAIDNYRTIHRNKPSTTNEILKIASPIESLSLPLDMTDRKEKIIELAERIKDQI